MDLSLFEYHLPPELIAQEPAEPRDASRLLVVDRARRSWQDRRFGELPALLGPGDCLVANESKVIPARLLGTREADGRPLELLMLRPLAVTRWEALVRPGRRCRVGARVLVAAGAARATVVAQADAPLGTQNIPLKLHYQACNNKVCLPPTTLDVNAQVTVVPTSANSRRSHPELFPGQ